jgi:hypothetical protein
MAFISERLNTLALGLLALKSDNISTWLQLFDPDSLWMEMSLEKESRRFAPPLYYYSLTGLVEVTPVLLKTDADINAQAGLYGTVMQTASSGGHEKIVELQLSELRVRCSQGR